MSATTYYIVVGRQEWDDEDHLDIYPAASPGDARDQFIEDMLASRGYRSVEDQRADYEEEYGTPVPADWEPDAPPTIYVNYIVNCGTTCPVIEEGIYA